METNGQDGVIIKGEKYHFEIATPRRAKKVAAFLRIKQGMEHVTFDPFIDKVTDVDWILLLSEESNTLEVLRLIFTDKIEGDSILDNMTAGDIKTLVMDFFFRA